MTFDLARSKHHDSFFNRHKPTAGALLALGVAACGVQVHPHGDAAPVNTSCDFGCAGAGTGSPPGFGGTPPSGAGGAPVFPGAGGFPPAGAGTFGAGGTLIGSGGVPVPPGAGAGGAPPGAGGLPPGLGGNGGAPMPPPTGAGGVPPSGVTITLGMDTVPKENAIAFIHFGHSNMAGRATGPATTKTYFFTTAPHAFMYHAGMAPQLAVEPYTADDDLSGLYGGPGTAIVKEAAELAPDKYFISLGFAKTSAYCSQFLPGALYYNNVMQAPLAAKDKVTFGAIIVMLGITERHGTSADITGYSTCINNLVTQIRTDLGRPDLPLLITDYEQMATGPLAVGQAFPNQIMPEIRKIPMVVSNSALVPTDALGMQDDHHFNFDGHKEWVRRALQIMKDKGWWKW